MDASSTKKPKTMAELLPGLSGILSKDAMITLTAKKQPRKTIANTRTAEKVLKPLTIAEMRADIISLRVQSPRRYAQGTASAKKKWNSSVKVENKTVSHTANGQMKHNSVRKVLNFQPPKPKPQKPNLPTSRMTMMTTETPKFPKPELKLKRPLQQNQARNTVRISGICKMPETPLITNSTKKPQIIPKNRMTIANKENIKAFSNKKLAITPKPVINKRIPLIPDTPLSNESWKSSCDASFLQNEKDIETSEAKTNGVNEPSLERIVEIAPPMSTPFKDYRNVKEYFNNSSDVMESTDYQDNTIMCFDVPYKDKGKREESVIVSLCDMLNKATVSTDKPSTDLEDLLEVEKQAENNIRMIDNGIKTLNNIKQSQLKSLRYVRRMIQEKQNARSSESDKDKTVIETKDVPKIMVTPEKSSAGKRCSVIRMSKSPSYKIPKKNSLKKKVLCKSMPNVSGLVTPQKDMGDKALTVYMKMKERMNFLNTPVVKQRVPTEVPDTPAITSHNLQKQLDKLYAKS